MLHNPNNRMEIWLTAGGVGELNPTIDGRHTGCRNSTYLEKVKAVLANDIEFVIRAGSDVALNQ